MQMIEIVKQSELWNGLGDFYLFTLVVVYLP